MLKECWLRVNKSLCERIGKESEFHLMLECLRYGMVKTIAMDKNLVQTLVQIHPFHRKAHAKIFMPYQKLFA